MHTRTHVVTTLQGVNSRLFNRPGNSGTTMGNGFAVDLNVPFLITEQKCVLCSPNGVGRWRRVFSGGPTRLTVVGVSVGRNCRACHRGHAGGRAWPVECPHASAVGSGVLPAVA